MKSVGNMGVFTDAPFIIRRLLPEERINPADEEEWEAIDCNNRVVAFQKVGITAYPTYRVLRNRVGNETATWDILELIACAENEKHDTGAVHATPFENMLRCIRLLPSFHIPDPQKPDKTIVDHRGLLNLLNFGANPKDREDQWTEAKIKKYLLIGSNLLQRPKTMERLMQAHFSGELAARLTLETIYLKEFRALNDRESLWVIEQLLAKTWSAKGTFLT